MVRSIGLNSDESRIAVVVPAHCEERRIREVLTGIPAFVDEIVVVDDGSDDATFERAANCEQRDPRIDLVRHAYNRGVGAAVVRGYRRALRRGVDVAAVMAGDGQMDPSDLAAVVAPVVEGEADYATGNRLDHSEAREMPRVRRFGTWLLSALTGWIAGYEELRDSQCGYTAISADLLEALPLERVYPRYGYPNDLLLRIGARGARLAQPVVRPVYAGEKSGFSAHEVVGPISGILLQGLARRAESVVGKS